MHFYQSRNLIIKGESQASGNLWLGDYQAARNKRKLKSDGINAIVTAGLGMKISYTADFKHKMLPLYDHQAENIKRFFDTSFSFIDEALQSGNVLIHCYAGVSRSTTILTAYLMRKNSWSLKEVLDLVKKQRPFINPNKGFKSQLRKFEGELNGWFPQKIQDKVQYGKQKDYLSKVRVESRSKKEEIEGLQITSKNLTTNFHARQKSIQAKEPNKFLNSSSGLRSKTLQKQRKF